MCFELKRLQIFEFMLEHINVKEDILKDEKYDYLFSVEKINELVMSGASFREASARSEIPLK